MLAETLLGATALRGAFTLAGYTIPVPDHVPDHESAVRRLMADASGGSYVAYAAYDEARQDPDAALIMEGDYGGQIYLACPLSTVAASEAALHALLRDLDKIAWDDTEGAAIRYERAPAGTGIAGGMGGGAVTDAIWVHEDFVALRLDDAIRHVIRGHRDRLR